MHISPFQACSGFSHVGACCFAQPPTAAFVTRLRPAQLPMLSARPLTDFTNICHLSVWLLPPQVNCTEYGALPNSAVDGRKIAPIVV